MNPPIASPARRRMLAGMAALLAAPTALRAQAPFPSQPIRIIVPFGPGGSPDVFSRMLAKDLSERVKQSVIVENRPGANSILGTSYVARNVPADGYTLLYGTNSGLSAAPAMVKSLNYDPVNDLCGVAMVQETCFAMVVSEANKDLKLDTLFQRIRANPSQVQIGGASVTTLITDKLMAQAGKLGHVYVPYKENSRMLNELMGGQIVAGYSPIPSVTPLIASRKLFPIALTGPERLRVLPGTPTISEALPGVALATWTGYFAPAKTPRPIVAKLHALLTESMQTPELQKYVLDVGRPLPMSPEQIDAFVRNDEPRWRALVAQTGVEPE